MILLPASDYTLDELTQAYNQTRTDYLIPMPMNPDRLNEYITLYDVDLPSSRVAVVGETIVGLGMLGRRPGQGWITRLGVLPEGRRQGIGGAMLQALMEQAALTDVHEVWLEVIKNNQPALELFRRHQFQPTRELIIARRPPRASHNAAALLAARKIYYLQHEEVIDLHCAHRERMNWLNAVDSMRNVRRLAASLAESGSADGIPLHQMPHLSGILVEFHDGSRGWVTYLATTLELKRIAVEVTSGAPVVVTACLLELLHRLHAAQDAVVENIPDDERWQGFQRAGYFEVFRRIEMVRPAEASDYPGSFAA
ncbi:MAG: GNAT family N-acetyltransferase [Candidatus Promineofilum sp.]|jgi:ribosomal protein S18 acetylase RimI-like enzyme|nr:GNAT family N-acetyltransferase [Promineifilum sp.]